MDKQSKAGEIGYTLSQHHHRLLIEDIMGIAVGKELILLIHQDHHFLHKQNETWWSRRIKSIGTSDMKGRCNYVKFQSNLYYALKVKVCSNPQGEDLYNSIYTKNEILYGCTKKGGWGITIKLANSERQEILFHDLLECPKQLHMWVHGESTNYQRIKSKLKALNNTSLTATVQCLLDEAYGDSILCQDLCHRYTTIVGQREQKIKATAVASATICSRQIKDHCSLPPNNPAFVGFRDVVNKRCMDIVAGTYGWFNIITDPLLSYTDVSHLIDHFSSS
jgi:hypothetical protein